MRRRAFTVLEAIIAVVIIVASIAMMFVLMRESQVSSEPIHMPFNATNVVNIGNGWTSFELNGTKFLYHRSRKYGSGYEALTAIPKE